MKNNEMSALDAYINRAYKIIIVLPLMGATTSAFVFSIFSVIGWWTNIPMPVLVIYDLVNAAYLLIAAFLLNTCEGEDGTIKPEKMRQGKWFVGIVVVAQWNAISYMIPDHEWWAYLFFFIALTIVFFDFKFTAILTGLLLISTFVSWIVCGEYQFLDVNDELFYPTFILRLFCIGLTTITLLCITYFGGKYLVEELERHASYDTLTHLLNRRSMDKYMKEAYKQANDGESTFCLLMIDIDDFKKVNDTYGHDCGDEVLKNVAHIVKTGVKKDDFVFRWGGEEILVLLKTDYEKAKNAADRIRKDIAQDTLVYKNEQEIVVTITVGVAAFQKGKTVKDLMEEADENLYYGKQHGKNQVVGFEEISVCEA